jgi:hypothetical protein
LGKTIKGKKIGLKISLRRYFLLAFLTNVFLSCIFATKFITMDKQGYIYIDAAINREKELKK